MLSRFLTSKMSKIISMINERSYSGLAKMAKNFNKSQKTTQKTKPQDQDVIISTCGINDNSLVSHIIECLQSCQKPNSIKQTDRKLRILNQNAIPSHLNGLKHKTNKQIVLFRDPKQCGISFFEWKKNLLYSTKGLDELSLNKSIYIGEYLFSNSLGYTPYLFLVEWYKYLNNNKNNNNNNVLFLFYEDFINNKKQTITKLANYLDLDIEEDLIDHINIENIIDFTSDNVLDDKLNEECNNFWKNYVGYHTKNIFNDYDSFRAKCNFS